MTIEHKSSRLYQIKSIKKKICHVCQYRVFTVLCLNATKLPKTYDCWSIKWGYHNYNRLYKIPSLFIIQSKYVITKF